jgi:predicted hydrocarbon binding protein
VVPALPWRNLRHRITEKFGGHASALLFETGLILGSTFGEEFMTYPGEPDLVIRRLCDLAGAAGWGILVMIGDTQYGSKLNVVVANCIFCDGVTTTTSDQPICDFLTGAVKGITDKVYGTSHRVYEDRCIAMGDSICEVVVLEEEDEDRTPGPVAGANHRSDGTGAVKG